MAKRAAEISVAFEQAPEILVSFSDELEVSLDCNYCVRTSRTVIFRLGDETARCCPGSGRKAGVHPPFPGRIRERHVRRSSCGDVLVATYSLECQATQFVDAKYGAEGRLWTGRPTWARVGWTATCPGCGHERRDSTQNNLVRPVTRGCPCGYVFHVERMEMPQLSWLEPESGEWHTAPERFPARA